MINYEVIIQNNSLFIDSETKELIANSKYGAPLINQCLNQLNVFIKLYRGSLLVGLIVGRYRVSNFIRILTIDMSPLISNIINEQRDTKIILISSLITYCKNNNISYMYFSHWTREEDDTIFAEQGIDRKKYASFVLPLLKEENDMLKIIPTKKRNMIRKGKKMGIVVKHFTNNTSEDDIKVFQNLMKTTQERALQRNKKSSMQLKQKEFIKNILLSNTAFLSLAFDGEIAVAGALIIISGEVMYYYLGGSNIDINKQKAASDLLHWEIINFGRKMGVLYYDLGGVPVNPKPSHPGYGVFKFKQKFGGEYKEYYGGIYSSNLLTRFVFSKVLENKFILRKIQRKIV